MKRSRKLGCNWVKVKGSTMYRVCDYSNTYSQIDSEKWEKMKEKHNRRIEKLYNISHSRG